MIQIVATLLNTEPASRGSGSLAEGVYAIVWVLAESVLVVGVVCIHDGQACAWAGTVWATLHVIQTLGYEVAFMFAAVHWISSWHWQCQDVANN